MKYHIYFCFIFFSIYSCQTEKADTFGGFIKRYENMSSNLIDSLHPHFLTMRTPQNIIRSNYFQGSDSLNEVFNQLCENTGFIQDSFVKICNIRMIKFTSSYRFEKIGNQDWGKIESNRKVRIEYPEHEIKIIKDSIKYRYSYGLVLNRDSFVFNGNKYGAIDRISVIAEDLKLNQLQNELGEIEIFIVIPNSISKPSKTLWSMRY